jgi:hypothetical protein
MIKKRGKKNRFKMIRKENNSTVCRNLASSPVGRIYLRKALDPHWQAVYLNKLLSIVVQSLPVNVYERLEALVI